MMTDDPNDSDSALVEGDRVKYLRLGMTGRVAGHHVDSFGAETVVVELDDSRATLRAPRSALELVERDAYPLKEDTTDDDR